MKPIPIATPRTAPRPPHRALWELTWRCDVRCEHCLVDGGEKRDNEMTTDECLRLADDIADLGISAVSLTGGEPFLRKDWFAVASRVRSHGMQLRFSSNGHLLDESIAGALVDLECESFSRQHRRRQGNERPAASRPVGKGEALDLRHDARRHRNPAPHAHHHHRAHVRLETKSPRTARNSRGAEKAGVHRWVIQLSHPTGRLTKDSASGLCEPIDPEQLPIVADFITRHANDPMLQPRAFNSVGYMSRKEPVLRQSGRDIRNPIWRGCQCGIASIGIEPDGGIKGCANMVGDPFIVGNVRTESLRTIWEDRPRWHWLNPKPQQMTGECAGCALASICHAGCTVLAYRSTGEFFNNPYCLRRLENASPPS
ncbi:MAG: radical SAM protein [Deltaproteobacteria bacterium]|nr:radical SAM protein [Deltaproteobacteria bacterium]